MSKSYKKKQIIAAGLLLTVIALGVTGWWLLTRTSSATLNPAGGEGWNASHSVGVRVAAGNLSQTTKVTFGKAQSHDKAPADTLQDVIGNPVTITPDRTIPEGKAEVVFRVPSSVPTDVNCTEHNPQRKRSICNISIEVYNPTWQAWIPLDTHIEHGDTVVATAPHFSDYRLGQTKIGDVTIDLGRKVNLTLDGDSSPFGLVGEVVASYFKQFVNNLTGTFDKDKKAPCDKSPATEYTIDFTENNPNNKIDGCVIRDHGTTKLLVSNGWSIPIVLTAGTDHGVTADRFNQVEFTTALRNWDLGRTVLKGNSTIASALDTATFTIDDSIVPNSFTVTAEASLYGAVEDIELSIFDLFPATKTLAPRAGDVKDILNCGSTIYQQHHGNEITEPESMANEYAELTQKCLTPAVLKKAELGEYADTIIKETKVTPEINQASEAIGKYLSQQGDIVRTAFVVSKPLAALKGQWTYECQGAGNYIDFVDDGSSSWRQTVYDANNNATTYDTFFQVQINHGRPELIIDKTQLPEVRAGDTMDILFLPTIEGRKPGIHIINRRDGGDWIFFQPGGASYC